MAFKMNGPSLYRKEPRTEIKGINHSDPSRADGRASSSPFQQRVVKEGEGQDEDKIFDDKGNHIGDYVNGKKVMKSRKSAHGQLNDAEREFEADKKLAKKKTPLNQVDLSKKTGLGPSAAFGGSKNRELVPEKKTESRKVMKDGAVNETHAAWLAKNKANFEKMTASEKKNAQDTANAKRKAFEASPEYKARRAAINNKKK
jgi:hypothetical protein